MKYSNEEIVTKILSSKEILPLRKFRNFADFRSQYNLGEYLKNPKPEPSRFGIRYVFVK